MAAPVWLGFIFLLDPINARLGGESLSPDLRARQYDRLINLALSGLLCGVLWEFWNYWSRAKWHYTVPIMENLKVFEMPVPGLPRISGVRARVLHHVRVRRDQSCVVRVAAAGRAARPADRVVISRRGGLNSRMAATLEREIKLRSTIRRPPERQCSRPAATPFRGRRLQDDACSTPPTDCCASAVRCCACSSESGTSLLTFKGPVQPSMMKLREELETAVGDGTLMLRLLEELGFRVWFRYQKYREEFALARRDVIIAIDETPVGTYVEIEGGERGIATATGALGREAADYLLDSYRGLFVRHCEATWSAGHRHGLRRRAQAGHDARARAGGRARHAAAPADRCLRQAGDSGGGEPIIRRIVGWLAAQVSTIWCVNLHHLPHTVTAVLGDGSDLAVRVRYSWEQPRILGSAGGPRHALDIIGDGHVRRGQRRYAHRLEPARAR